MDRTALWGNLSIGRTLGAIRRKTIAFYLRGTKASSYNWPNRLRAIRQRRSGSLMPRHPQDKNLSKLLKRAVSLIILILIAGCDSKEEADYTFPFEPGVELKIKAFGHYYYSEVVKAEGPYVTWKLRWNDRVVSMRKDYKGLISVYVSELEQSFVNEFETASIDQLFPLAVGKDVSFKGFRVSKEDGTEVPFWVHMAVREESVIKVRDKAHNTFVIEVTTEYEKPDRTVTVTRTLWYAPELGFSLKSDYRSADEHFQMHVLSIITPEEEGLDEDRRRRTLGTVRI
jgi:hypothetical protein